MIWVTWLICQYIKADVDPKPKGFQSTSVLDASLYDEDVLVVVFTGVKVLLYVMQMSWDT